MTEFDLNLDSENMLGYIDALPDDLEKAWKLGHSLPLAEFGKIKMIVICGMGGSAIGGDFLGSYLSEISPVPILAIRGYDLPAWASGKETLVVCSSHSGNTEETLSAFQSALEKDCSLLALTTGGKLQKLAEENHVPVWVFEHVGQPRTAIPFSFGMLLALVERLGIVADLDAEIEEAVAVMRQQRQKLTITSPVAANPAKRLAGQLLKRNIVIFGSGSLEVIARRWKTQINELAKAWASFEGIPEMNHNTLAGLLFPESLYEQTSAIFLRADMDHPRNALRIQAGMPFFLEAGIGIDTIKAIGETRLAQMWSLLQFGDYVSYYLALHYGIDPTPVEALSTLKQKLAQS